MKSLFLLITIVQREDCEEYENFYLTNGVNVIYSTISHGTAHEKTLDMLGIEKTEKTMLLCPVTGLKMKEIMKRLTMEMQIDLPNRGVAMAIPFSGIGGARTLEYFSGEEILEINKEGNDMQSSYELIMAIYEKGYTTLVMDAAREAGASGGTTVKAKGTAKEAEKFFGLSIAEEKEILFIVSSAEKKKDIMKAIMTKAGIDSKAHTVLFSLPVSDTAGFRFADSINKEI
jgi:hypothetical protein